MVKNACYNNLKLQNIQFPVTSDKEKNQIFTFKELEAANIDARLSQLRINFLSIDWLMNQL